ncbi:MAG: type VI secretion system baseplate subunit TssF [Burkholderiaceae bacterium]
MTPEATTLQSYYLAELTALRELGAEFAQRHPKIAGALDLGPEQSQDPHTERLIEAFAFLTARLQLDLDREFPRIAQSVIDHLCPALLQPTPSMSIARFEWQERLPGATTGLSIPAQTMLAARSQEGVLIRFRTGWETRLLPMTVGALKREDDGAVTLCLQTLGQANLEDLDLSQLRFYLHGDWSTLTPLLELLLADTTKVSVGTELAQLRALPSPPTLTGLGDNEGILPCPPSAHPAYSLLQEYFAFPHKFHFITLQGIENLGVKGKTLFIRFHLGPSSARIAKLSEDNFQLGCVPVVNLFQRTTEPILVTDERHEWLVVGDHDQESSTEIHSLVEVSLSQPGADRPNLLSPFGAMGDFRGDSNQTLWMVRRDQSLRKDITGTDLFISFVDRSQSPVRPPNTTIYAQALCCNRGLAEQVPAQTQCHMETTNLGIKATLLLTPSTQKSPPLGGDAAWRLTRLVRLHHGNLLGPSALSQLQALLQLFAGDQRRDSEQIAGIVDVQARRGFQRLGQQPWASMLPGTEIDFRVDPKSFSAGSAMVFSAVLSRFFSLYTTVNNFTQTSLWQGDDCLKRWPAATGYQELL